MAALDEVDIALPPCGLRGAVGRGEGGDERDLRDALGCAAHHLERDEAAHRVRDQHEFRGGVVEQALCETPDRVVAAVVGDDHFAVGPCVEQRLPNGVRSEEHTSELQSLMRISYAAFCLKKKKLTATTCTLHQ